MARARYAKNVKKWQWLAGGFVFLVVLGSCVGNDDDKTDGQAATAKVDLDTAPILAGTVTEVDSPHVSVDVGSRYPIEIMLAHTGPGNCSGMSDAYGKRLVASLPIGSQVTLVRTPEDAGSTKMGDKVFVHLATSDSSAGTAPSGPSVNEQVIATGDGVFLPSLDHQRDAAPIDVQLPALLPQVSAVAEPYVDAMVTAEMAAWDERRGGLGACRTEQERRNQDLDDYKREHYGEDLTLGTADDPDLNVDAPNVNVPNGGGGGGGGGICSRSRWC